MLLYFQLLFCTVIKKLKAIPPPRSKMFIRILFRSLHFSSCTNYYICVVSKLSKDILQNDAVVQEAVSRNSNDDDVAATIFHFPSYSSSSSPSSHHSNGSATITTTFTTASSSTSRTTISTNTHTTTADYYAHMYNVHPCSVLLFAV